MPSNYGGAAPLLLGISCTECAIATVLVLTCAYAASIRAGRLRWDFLWVASATVLGIICQVLMVLACYHGIGNHLIYIQSIDSIFEGLKYMWIGLMIGVPTVVFGKFGIVALLFQVTTPQQLGRRWLLWGVSIFYLIVNVAQIVITFTQCTPYQKLWYQMIPGNCDRKEFANNFGIFQGSVAVAMDLFLASYPISIVWDLQISNKSKAGFCMLMAGGILPAAAGLMRTVYIDRLNSSRDPTFELSKFLAWAFTELWFVIILGCIPPLRPLFLHLFEKAKTLASSRHGGTVDTEGPHGCLDEKRLDSATGSQDAGGISKTSEYTMTVSATAR